MVGAASAAGPPALLRGLAKAGRVNHEEGDPVTPGPSEAVAHAVSSLGPAPVLAPRARSRRLRALVLRALGPVAVIVAWEVVGLLVPANRHLIPPPTAVLGAMWDDRVLYRINVSTTAWEALQGFLIGSGAAFVAAVVIVQFSFVEHYVMRVAIVIRALPLLAVAPVLVVIFAGETSKVAMAIIVVFFPTLIAVIIGLRSAEQAALDVIRVFGGGQAMCLWKVRLSASLPWLFAGLVIAAPSAVVGAILGEFFGGNSGLGVALIQAMSVLDTDRVWGFALAATFLSGVAVVLIRVLQRVLIKWSPNIDVAARRSANAAGGGLRTAMFKLFTLVTSVVLILALWNGFIAVMHLNRFFAKTPLDVARYLFSGPLAPGQRNAIVHALLVTLGEASYGFVIGTALAIALAVVFVVFPRASDALMPVAIGFRAGTRRGDSAASRSAVRPWHRGDACGDHDLELLPDLGQHVPGSAVSTCPGI